ncbi:MAG TPA: DEAD/DEAH box helicase [Gemmatimonadales bacterium]|nr:DEAD/DEAH box helicase [Gemmatimonadales bacterium]
MAESLRVAAEPPTPAVELSPAAAGVVAASLARLAYPPTAADSPPRWLRPAQVEPWRRVVGAVREYRGALLAGPPGTGKTWIALAAAMALTRRPVTCLVPAVVQSQWRAVAARIGVPISIGTHEQASRGRLPACHELVIVDESHHYRSATIKRCAHVARWLAGRKAILLSGTPVVNRLDDLLHQLALAIRDDALALHGLPSLRALSERREFPEAISRIVIRSAEDTALPNQRLRTARFRLGLRVSHVLRAVRALDISPDRGVRALVRGVLMRAAASSPVALAGALRRYGFLLANHADAVLSGCAVSRDDLRKWAGAGGEQTVMWAVVRNGGESAQLCPDDAIRVRSLLAMLADISPEHDPKAALLTKLLADGRRTLVFTTSRESVAWLRRALGYHRTAWCTGDGAGIGMARWPRDEVLRLFGPEARTQAPAILVSTDIAAEGLDLQRAERVVHYDLPWTPARLEQRVGRAARLGAAVAEVDVVRFDPPRMIERAIHSVRILSEKAELPERARVVNGGLGGWPAAVATASTAAAPRGGIALITETSRKGILAGLEITGFDEQGRLVSGGRLLWIDEGGTREGLADLAAPLLEALAAGAGPTPCEQLLRTTRATIDLAVNQLLTMLNGSVWERTRRPELAGLIERLRHVRRRAVEQRDAATAGLVSNVLRLAASGRTAGETLLLKDLASTTGRSALRAMALLPRARPVQRFEVTVAGVVVFGDG